MSSKAAERAEKWIVEERHVAVSMGLSHAQLKWLAGVLADYEAATIERCAGIADAAAEDAWDRYKGYGKYEKQRGTYDPDDQGRADGAGEIAAAIRSMGDEK